jgi:lipopolysaccharide biosynthesis glycosyltransferase
MTDYVVYATDENYWTPLYVSLHSLLANNRDRTLEIFVLSKQRNEEFFDNVAALEDIHGDFSIQFVRVDDSDFAGAPQPQWLSEGIYYRLLIQTLLPLEDERVLYIDCDTIVDGSLTGLFETDLGDGIAAATPEMKNKSFRMGLPVDARFYNTGVMYIDLGNWRAHDVQDRALDYIRENPDMKLPLQEILNVLLYESDGWVTAGPEYNTMGRWAEVVQAYRPDVDPIVVHYTGRAKPWLYRTIRPYKELWWDYLAETPYRDYQSTDRSVSAVIGKGLERAKRAADSGLESYPRLHGAVSKVYSTLFR